MKIVVCTAVYMVLAHDCVMYSAAAYCAHSKDGERIFH